MKLSTGIEEFDIHESGSVITFGEEPITFHLPHDLKIRMSFSDDKETKERKMHFQSISPKELQINLINFTNILGSGNAQPLPLATLENRQYYLNFFVQAFESSANKMIHYTWYRREVVSNG